MTKSGQTRSLIVRTAMALFEEKGYDRTTMRAIATEAGVSVGNAYYYFSSKEQLIQGFYDQIAQQHQQAAADILGREHEFTARLRGVLLAWLELAAPYHRFGTQFFVNAADPGSPLSPFSPESTASRDAAIAVMREVIADSGLKVAPELREELPHLLWLYQMGVVLFWVHDRSAAQARTRMLIERTVPLLTKVLGLSRLPVLRSASGEIVSLIRDLTQPAR
jgi:AcrR family transcriptional regulator